jgi:hypothetical protein
MYYRDEANRLVKANLGAGQVAEMSDKELSRVHTAIMQLRSDVFQVAGCPLHQHMLNLAAVCSLVTSKHVLTTQNQVRPESGWSTQQ